MSTFTFRVKSFAATFIKSAKNGLKSVFQGIFLSSKWRELLPYTVPFKMKKEVNESFFYLTFFIWKDS